MNERRNSKPADALSKTPPMRVRVRKIVARDGTLFVSFEGMNSWYAVPPHLETIIRQAAHDRRPIAITTTPNAVVTAKRSRPRKFPSYSGPSLADYIALGRKKHRRDRDYDGI